MLVALSSPSTPGLGGPVPHDAPGAHPAQGAAFAMVAYAGAHQPIYMPRFGFYVAQAERAELHKRGQRGPSCIFRRPCQLRSDTAIPAYTVECRM